MILDEKGQERIFYQDTIWDKYYTLGRDIHSDFSLPKVNHGLGGGVFFKRHLNNPLSKQLWEDILFRMGCTSLRIYTYGEGIKTIGYLGVGLCFIYLNEDKTVSDIEYYPHRRN